MAPYNQYVTFNCNVVCFKHTAALCNVNVFSFGLLTSTAIFQTLLAFSSGMTGNNLLESV